jgi:hypothetical protein
MPPAIVPELDNVIANLELGANPRENLSQTADRFSANDDDLR